MSVLDSDGCGIFYINIMRISDVMPERYPQFLYGHVSMVSANYILYLFHIQKIHMYRIHKSIKDVYCEIYFVRPTKGSTKSI